MLIAFVVLTCIFVHNFWTMEGPARIGNQVNFYKNLVIIGALLLLYIDGPGAVAGSPLRQKVTGERDLKVSARAERL